MVEIKTSKAINPKIYAYTTPTVSDNNGWIKIGYTEREVIQRIKEQTHTAQVATDILWTGDAFYTEEPNKGKIFKDHDFHHYLAFHDVKRRPKTEWFYFNGTPEKSKYLFNKFIKHDTSGYQPGKGQEYTLRKEQEQAVSKTVSYIKENSGGKFLWNAKPRFGKTLSTYDLIRRIDAVNVLIVTNRPAIANSWYDDFEKFIAGKTSYKFISESDSLKNRPTLTRREFVEILDDDVRQIAFISLQDLKGSIYLGGDHDKLKWVTDLNWDLLVIDEAHEGVDTFKTDIAFNKIKRDFTLHLSGTPFKALAKGDFTEEQIYNWSYADEQLAKQNWSYDQDEENPYEILPQLNLFTYQMSKMIGRELEEGAQLDGENIDYAFDLSEFFATDEKGKFIHEQDVRNWLDTLATNEKYPFSTKELRNELKHTFWLLERVSSAKALKILLEEHPIYENYKIILAAGDGRMSETDDRSALKSLELVRQAISDNDKTITLSVGQLTTGVTIPEWTGVLMLSNIKSPSLYMQSAFRAQNPYSWENSKGEHFRKEHAYVFDFAPERTLIIFDEFANNLSLDTACGAGTSEKREENIRELLNFFPVIAEDRNGKMIEIDAKAVLTIPRQIKAREVLKRGFMSNFLFDNINGIFQGSQTVLDILNELPVEKEGKVKNSSDILDFSEVTLDSDGNPSVDNQIVVNKQMRLFGEKIYGLGESVTKLMNNDDKKSNKNLATELSKEVSSVIVDELKAEYLLKTRETEQLKKQIKTTFENEIRKNEIERKIAEAYIKEEIQQEIEKAEDKGQIENLQESLKRRLEKNNLVHNEKLKDNLKTEVEQMPEKLIEQVEIKRVEELKQSAQDEIRDHLRGFSRTIPSFIMAYGDENLTLATFDTYVPDNIFYEVTGITIEQFRYLRDGGHDFIGHLFDRATFDEAIQEFLRKKNELSNYFEDQKEDIFDYIPPQKTNQIFTPKRDVKRMVDDLENENPGIFNDSSKTFIDLYMKSGLYIAELVKRLYNSDALIQEYPNRNDRLKHILEKQVFGFAPSEIIFNIAVNFIFGNLSNDISRKNFVQKDTIPFVKEGKIQQLVDSYFD